MTASYVLCIVYNLAHLDCFVKCIIPKFYYPLANVDKKKIIDGTVRENAESYLFFYIQVLNESFANLKNRFYPRESDEIGFLGMFDLSRTRIQAHSFRSIKKNEDRVALIPGDGSFWSDTRNDNRMYLMGGTRIHSAGADNGFVSLDIKRAVLDGEIVSQLTVIIDEGLLNESQNYYLGLEKILGIIVSKQREIHGIKDNGQLTQYLPISIDKIEYGLRYRKAYDYYNNKLIDQKIKQGSIKVTWKGTGASYCISLSDIDRKTIHQQAQDAASSNVDYDTRDVDFKKVEKALKEALACIKQSKTVIDEIMLPDQDSFNGRGYFFDSFQRETLVAFLSKFYSTFLQEYKKLIEVNFPSFTKCFSLYSQIPVHYFIHVKKRHDDDTTYCVYKCANAVSNSNQVTVYEENELPLFDNKNFILTYHGLQYKTFTMQWKSFRSLYPSKKYLPFNLPSEFAILRAAIYDEIKHDLPVVVKQLYAVYGQEYR